MIVEELCESVDELDVRFSLYKLAKCKQCATLFRGHVVFKLWLRYSILQYLQLFMV